MQTHRMDLLFASYVSRKNQMQIPRFGLAASLGMTKQVGESRFEDCSLRERSFRSVEWRELECVFHSRAPQRCAAAPSLLVRAGRRSPSAHLERRFQSPEMVRNRL